MTTDADVGFGDLIAAPYLRAEGEGGFGNDLASYASETSYELPHSHCRNRRGDKHLSKVPTALESFELLLGDEIPSARRARVLRWARPLRPRRSLGGHFPIRSPLSPLLAVP